MKKRFILITILALIVIVGGVGIGLAWRTNRLDKWLPLGIIEIFGKGWKTFENESFGISFKYPRTYQITEEQGIEAGKFNGLLELDDQTRAGNPHLWLNFNFYGGFEAPECANLIYYETVIKEGKVEVLSRSASLLEGEMVKLCEEEFGYIDKERYRVRFTIGAWPEWGSYGPYEGGTKENWILVHFTYEKVDYEPEIKQIIETIRITKEEIYGK